MKILWRVLPPVLLALLSVYTFVFHSQSLTVNAEEERTAMALPASAGDVVVLVMDFENVERGALAEASLRAMQDIDRRLFDADWVRSYSGPLNATVVRAEGDEILVEPFLPPDILEDYAETRVDGLAAQYERFPELAPYFSAGFSACAFYVEPGISMSAQALVSRLDGLREEIRSAHGVSFSYTGIRPVRAHIEQYLTRDALRVLPTAFVLVTAVYVLAFGDARVLVVSWMVKILATTAAYACYRLFFDIVSPLVILIPVFSFGLLSDYLIHVVYHSRDSRFTQPASLRRFLLIPLSLTAATSAIGFSTLALLGNPGHVLLAVVVAGAIVLVYVLALWWVPAVLVPTRVGGLNRTTSTPRWVRMVHRRIRRALSGAIIGARRRRSLIAVACIAVLVFLGSFIPRLRVEPYPVHQLPENSAVAEAERLLTRDFAGTVPFVVQIDGGDAGAFLSPEGLLALEEVHRALEAEESIGYVRSVLSVITRMHYYFNGADPAYLTVPEGLEHGRFAQLVEQYLLFYSASVSPEEYESLVDSEHRTIAVQGILRYRDGASLDRLSRAVHAGELGAPDEWRFEIGGVAAGLIARKRSLEGNWYLSFGIGALLIFGVVSILYRSLLMAVVALIPSLAVLIGVSGLSALAGVNVDEYTVIVIVIGTGLTIDYTIHPLNAIWRTRAPGDRSGMVRYAHSVARGAGVPVLMSLLTTVLAFSSLLLSAFRGAVHFSLMLSLSVVAAFCGGVLLVPAFFAGQRKETLS